MRSKHKYVCCQCNTVIIGKGDLKLHRSLCIDMTRKYQFNCSMQTGLRALRKKISSLKRRNNRLHAKKRQQNKLGKFHSVRHRSISSTSKNKRSTKKGVKTKQDLKVAPSTNYAIKSILDRSRQVEREKQCSSDDNVKNILRDSDTSCKVHNLSCDKSLLSCDIEDKKVFIRPKVIHKYKTRRKGKRPLKYYCRTCKTTLLSWGQIRKHLFSSQHLRSTSKLRKTMEKVKFNIQSPEEMQKCTPRTSDGVKLTDKPVKGILKLPKDFNISDCSSLLDKSINSLENLSESPIPNGKCADLCDSSKKSSDPSRSTPKKIISSAVVNSDSSCKSLQHVPLKRYDKSPNISSSIIRVDYKKPNAQEESSDKSTNEEEGEDSVDSKSPKVCLLNYSNNEHKDLHVNLGYRCDSFEFANQCFGNNILYNKETGVSMSLSSLCKVLKVKKEKDTLDSVKERKSCAANPSSKESFEPRTMIRYDYKKEVPENDVTSTVNGRKDVNLKVEVLKRKMMFPSSHEKNIQTAKKVRVAKDKKEDVVSNPTSKSDWFSNIKRFLRK